MNLKSLNTKVNSLLVLIAILALCILCFGTGICYLSSQVQDLKAAITPTATPTPDYSQPVEVEVTSGVLTGWRGTTFGTTDEFVGVDFNTKHDIEYGMLTAQRMLFLPRTEVKPCPTSTPEPVADWGGMHFSY